MKLRQMVVHRLRGYGTHDSPYKNWFIKFAAWYAPRADWRGVWMNGEPRPWIGNRKDPRMASDEEFREIIKQNKDNGMKSPRVFVEV